MYINFFFCFSQYIASSVLMCTSLSLFPEKCQYHFKNNVLKSFAGVKFPIIKEYMLKIYFLKST